MEDMSDFNNIMHSMGIMQVQGTEMAGMCCGVQMEAGSLEYTCRACGRIKAIANSNADRASRAGQVRGVKKPNESLFQSTFKTLQGFSRSWSGNAFPDQILRETVDIYITLQESNPAIRKRGQFKFEILAAILHILCQNHSMNHKEDNVAQFIKLRHGFSQGYKIVQKIVELNPIPGFEINMDRQTMMRGFASRYLEALGIDTAAHVAFVCNLINLTETHLVGMSSCIDSKVIGAIWILQYEKKMGFSPRRLEEAADGTKKSTFMKYVKNIMANEICLQFIGEEIALLTEELTGT